MSSPYTGEIRMFGGNFAPAGWVFCDGSLISISENTALFQLIGTTYGGDGQNTFAVPDLRGRIPLHFGSSFVLGQRAGTETVTLITQQIPNHSHTFQASNSNASASNPSAQTLANSATAIYLAAAGLGAQVPLDPSTIQASGSNQPHNNLQPYLCVNFILSLFGVFPTQ